MGGFRCTYRNCSVRSDGKTHMFHYPVFDKPRCHKWLVQAQKLEFLDLKVSQLKNRVVCQHHFKDECFMNYKKEKLKFDAVPTELGPFCDGNFETEDSYKYTIALEDIEQENLTTKEKKANFSTKYGDFLINSDITDLPTLESDDNCKTIDKDPTNFLFPYFHPTKKVSSPSSKDHQSKSPIKVTQILPESNDKVEITIFPDDVNRNLSENDNKKLHKTKKISIIAEKTISSPVKIKGQLRSVSPSTKIDISKNFSKRQLNKDDQNSNNMIVEDQQLSNIQHRDVMFENPNLANENYVIINNPHSMKLEEANDNYIIIQNSVKSNVENNIFQQPADQDVNGKFVIMENSKSNNNANPQNDSFSTMSERNVNSNTCKLENFQHSISGSVPQPVQTIGSVENCFDKALSEPSLMTLTIDDITQLLNEPQYTQSQKSLSSLLKTDKSSPSKPVKSKIPPERLAAIEQKRKINKQKLWDMKLLFVDERDKNTNENRSAMSRNKTYTNHTNADNDTKKTDGNCRDLSDNVKNMLSGHPKLPSFEEYTIASLESRINKLEEILSRKIDQNSQRIIELKSMFSQECKGNICTHIQKQIPENEAKFKKRLFNEISQYLSPNVNSLIYEELFLNKLVKNINKKKVNTDDASETSALLVETRVKRRRKCKV